MSRRPLCQMRAAILAELGLAKKARRIRLASEALSPIGVEVRGLRRRSTAAGLRRRVAAIDPERDDRGLDGLLTPRIDAASERVLAVVLDLRHLCADLQRS